MKRIIRIFALITLILSACSDSGDEPKNVQPGNTTSDWTVIYTERCYSNPQWINQINITPECKKWKERHKPYLISHSGAGYLNEEVWTWEMKYHAKSESDVINDIVEFVKFTTNVKAGPEDDNRYGSDIFEATLINSSQSRYVTYRNKSPLFWFDSSHYRYRIEYHEYRLVQDGEYVQEPPLLEQWAQSHSDYLFSKNQTGNSRSRLWIEDKDCLSMSDIHTMIDPFINWSIGGADAKSFHRLMVRVHDYQEDITSWYSTVP